MSVLLLTIKTCTDDMPCMLWACANALCILYGIADVVKVVQISCTWDPGSLVLLIFSMETARVADDPDYSASDGLIPLTCKGGPVNEGSSVTL